MENQLKPEVRDLQENGPVFSKWEGSNKNNSFNYKLRIRAKTMFTSVGHRAVCCASRNSNAAEIIDRCFLGVLHKNSGLCIVRVEIPMTELVNCGNLEVEITLMNVLWELKLQLYTKSGLCFVEVEIPLIYKEWIVFCGSRNSTYIQRVDFVLWM